MKTGLLPDHDFKKAYIVTSPHRSMASDSESATLIQTRLYTEYENWIITGSWLKKKNLYCDQPASLASESGSATLMQTRLYTEYENWIITGS
jgi:hypothetical protein